MALGGGEGCLLFSKHREGAGKSKKQEGAHTLCLLCKIPSFCMFFFYWQYFTRAGACSSFQGTPVCYRSRMLFLVSWPASELHCHWDKKATVLGVPLRFRPSSYWANAQPSIHGTEPWLSPDLSRTRIENTAELEPCFKQIPYYGCISRMATDLLKVTYTHQCSALLVD